MRPHVDVLTLGVADLDRSLRFYRDGLGFETAGVIGTEYRDTASGAAGAAVMFQLERGVTLALYPREDLARDAGVAPGAPLPSSPTFSIGHLVGSRAEVDEILARALAAGATASGPARERPWGIYSAYFHDPDGHAWEVIWNHGEGSAT